MTVLKSILFTCFNEIEDKYHLTTQEEKDDKFIELFGKLRKELESELQDVETHQALRRDNMVSHIKDFINYDSEYAPARKFTQEHLDAIADDVLEQLDEYITNDDDYLDFEYTIIRKRVRTDIANKKAK